MLFQLLLIGEEDDMRPSNTISKLLIGFAVMIALPLLFGLVVPHAIAQETGFHILGKGDKNNVSLDVENSNNNIDGFVHLSLPTFEKESQLWDKLELAVLDNGGVRVLLRSQKLGFRQCLARDANNLTTTRPCGDDNTQWDLLPVGGGMFILQQTDGHFIVPNTKRCLEASDALGAATAAIDCTQPLEPPLLPIIPPNYFSEAIFWSLEPLGSSSQSSSSQPRPPSKPTGCSALGGTGTCGDVGFNCNRMSAADTIIAAATVNVGLGISKSESDPAIGVLSGHYRSEGQAFVSICAVNVKAGLHACSDPFSVTFGPTVCTKAPHNPSSPTSCPAHEIMCQGTCKRPENCEHRT